MVEVVDTEDSFLMEFTITGLATSPVRLGAMTEDFLWSLELPADTESPTREM